MTTGIRITLQGSKPPTTRSHPSSATTSNATAPPKIPSLFGNDQDTDSEPAPLQRPFPTTSSSSFNPTKPAHCSLSSAPRLTRQHKLAQEEAVKLDSSVFQYDEVYDDMKAARDARKAEQAQKAAQRKPQYISGLIESAKQRKIDRVRAEDKMVQRERESEGTEFADKDSFVTPAYLQQQAELRKAEEQENLMSVKEEERKKKAASMMGGGGMATFYKNLLEEDSRRHEAAVQAVADKSLKSPPSGVPTRLQYDPEPESVPDETKLAEAVGAKLGRKVDLNDEGQIVDHRQLLTGGLNLGPPKLTVGPQKPKKTGFAIPIAERAKLEREWSAAEAAKSKAQMEGNDEDEDGLSRAQKLKLSRERQSQLLQQQLIDLETNKRKTEEESKTETAKRLARRNTDDKVEALKQKALERRRAKEQARKEQETAAALITANGA